jgi:Ribonuclease G/E
MNKLDVSELKQQAEELEREYQQSVVARRAAVARSSQALAAATKAQRRYMRAVAYQGEGSDGA